VFGLEVLDHDPFDWSGWIFGLVGLAYIVVTERRFHNERRKLRNVAAQVEPSAPITTPLDQGRPGLTDDRIRSILIQVAVDSLPFSLAIERARRFNVDETTLREVAERLRASKLLSFGDPLQPDTKLKLT
jgi:hypothetical protein